MTLEQEDQFYADADRIKEQDIAKVRSVRPNSYRQELWIQVYLKSIQNGAPVARPSECADLAVIEFDKRFL